jgi:prephenate dehydrogenase
VQVRPLHRIGIVGLGLIGGSLARRLAPTADVVGYARDPSIRAAAAAAGIQTTDSLQDATAGRDTVVLATPLPALDDILPTVASTVDAAVLTDVTSVKLPVLQAVRRLPSSVRYVGGHPMAGTEHSGFAAGSADLFDGAVWVLCLEPDTDLSAWLQLAALYTSIGCRVVPCPADEHDAALARVSALPHVLACALAAAGDGGGSLALRLAAGSFRDGTRVAATRPELIAALCDGNRWALAEVLDETVDRLRAAAAALRSGGTVAELVAEGHDGRAHWQAMVDASAAVSTRSTVDRPAAALRAMLLALGAAGGYVEQVGADGQLHMRTPGH